ncbi:hypothetical protein [Candidatus Poriferisocius sp.]|uniref:hypothetical protein n=1 Tax=Candidatus Poriferisocius sp. TaxID=3101276 RepID=UPI003B518E65
MDQAILALLGVSITLMLYLDRGRRADIALLREETQRGFAQLTEVVMDLVNRVGRLEGRAEAASTPTKPSP